MSTKEIRRKSNTPRRRSIVLSEEAARKLKECEAKLRHELKDFVSVGSALASIQKDKLYQGPYSSFQDYCQSEWALPRHTAYLKIRVSQIYGSICEAAAAEGLSPGDLPTNEFQIRQLLILRTPASQWKAWHTAVTLRKKRNCMMTTDIVKEAVNVIRTDQTIEFQQYLTADNSFPLVPFRLDLYTLPSGSSTPQLNLDPISLHNQHGVPPSADLPSSPSLVLVSPQYDLFSGMASKEFLEKLLLLLDNIPVYRFLLWTSHFRRMVDFSYWPSNAEMVIRVNHQSEVEAFEEYWKQQRRKCAFWVVPDDDIEIPRMEFIRILVSAPASSNNASAHTRMIRQLVASVLNTGIPLHLDAAIRNTFTELTDKQPEVYSKISQKTLNVMFQ
ncbi:MAG: hypothetical protein ACYDBB_10580 [Armatimonadota bacterium]